MTDCGDPQCLERTHTVVIDWTDWTFKCSRCGKSAKMPKFLKENPVPKFKEFIAEHAACCAMSAAARNN